MALLDLGDLADLLWDPVWPVFRFVLRVLIVIVAGPFMLIWPWSPREGYRKAVARRFRFAWSLFASDN